MSAVLKSVAAIKKASSNDALLEKFDSRKSHELIVALAGPIGCGVGSVVEGLTDRLRERGYTDVVHIKLSTFLEEILEKSLVEEWDAPSGASERLLRYRRLQEAGKRLRAKTKNPAILAEYAAQEIAIDRTKRQREASTIGAADGPIVPGRVAYLVDQVKRPEEVKLLRAIYRNLVYVIGITRVNDHRVDQLGKELVRSEEIQGLIDIDRLEDDDGGQQLDKTLHLADYFLRNDAANVDEKKHKLNRFLDMIHGDKSVTPTDAEHGMYAAYSAGLRSACLSRQVGAAISATSGEVVATGCNDVPRAGGGLYSSSSPVTDMRCIHMDGRECFNDLYKRQLQQSIAAAVDKVLKNCGSGPVVLPPEDHRKLLAAIYETTRIKDLIEFSRSVHAEMDAIVALARIGGAGLDGATLYTTTFPCHNCARHIVAAGIMKVFYIEPYEKSLAKDLHKDSIAFEVIETKGQQPKRVEFLHYEGVAPKQFHNVFRAIGRKNSNSKFTPIEPQVADKMLPEYLDNYQDFESKAVEHLIAEVAKLKSPVPPG